mgnify:CR=1 FL=1
MPNNSDVLHHKIKAARNHAKMTQQQLADVLDVSRPAVSLWESNDPEVRNEPTRKLGELTPDQIKAVRIIIDSY